MLTELLAARPDFTPGVWQPCPPTTDRAAWDALPGFDRWLAAGNESRRAELPALPLSLWRRFTTQGDRAAWEHAYFARRKRVVRLAMAEAMAATGEFLPALADTVWAICEESAWQLPAHNSYIRDTPQLPLPDTSKPIVDLFAAETGALLAMVHRLHGKALDAYAPGLAARLAREVELRVLVPWRTSHFWWMGNGDEPMCNWTPWCTQNCLIATALLHPHAGQRTRAAVKQAAYSLDCFLKDYGVDGCCSEGAQYYRHAALPLFNALELLCALAPGVFEAAWQQPKIQNIAEYIVNMHVAGPYYLNFADCSPKAGVRGVREYLFGRRVGSAALAAFAAADFAADPDPDHLQAADDSEGINLFYAVQTAFAEAEVREAAKTLAACPPQKDCLLPSCGIRVLRAGPYVLGCKGGNNADSHNHNDAGSITLYKDGKPLLIDIGVETYTQKTFSPQRYEIWTMQSSWHNLPEFDPDGAAYQQQPGERYRAPFLCFTAEGTEMDLAPAYGKVPGLSYYSRSAALDEGGLYLYDETDYPGTVALTLMSAEAPQWQDDVLRFGTLAAAKFTDPVQRVDVQAVPVTDARLRTAWPATIYRTRVYFTGQLELRLV